MGRYTGKNALLTGAAGGIGKHIARLLAQQGINLIITGRQRDALETLASELRRHHVKVEVLICDLTDAASVAALPGQAEALLSPIDILINNAGIEEVRHYQDQDPAWINATIMTNTLAPLQLARAVLPGMIERGEGWIISMSSLAGILGMPYGATYAASKAAISQWTMSLHAELVGSGVTVAALAPGFVTGEGMFAAKDREAPGSLGSCTPEQTAAAVLKALDGGGPEIIINSMPVRPLMMLKSMSPSLMLWLSTKLGLIGFLGSIADDNGPDENRAGRQENA